MKAGAQKKVNEMVATFIRNNHIESFEEAQHLLSAAVGWVSDQRLAFIRSDRVHSAEERLLMTNFACELRDRRFLSTLLNSQDRDVFTHLLDVSLRAPWVGAWTFWDRALYAKAAFADGDQQQRAMAELRSLPSVRAEKGLAGMQLALQLAYCEAKNMRNADRDVVVYIAHEKFLEEVDPDSPWAVLGTFAGIMRLVGTSTPATPKELRFASKRLQRKYSAMGLDVLEGAGSAEVDLATGSKVRTQAYIKDLLHLLETTSKIKDQETEDLWIDVVSTLPTKDMDLAVKTGAELDEIWQSSRLKPSIRSLRIEHAQPNHQAITEQLTTENIPFEFISDLPDDPHASQFTRIVILRLLYSVLQLYCQEAIVYNLLLQSEFGPSAELALCFGLWLDRITMSTLEAFGEAPTPYDFLNDTGHLDIASGLEGAPCFQPERTYTNALALLRHGLRMGLRILDDASPWAAAKSDWQSLLDLLVKVPLAVSWRQPPLAFNHYNVKAAVKLEKHRVGCQMCRMGAESECKAGRQLRATLSRLNTASVAEHNAVRDATARSLNFSKNCKPPANRPKTSHRLRRSQRQPLALPLGSITSMRSRSLAVGELRVLEWCSSPTKLCKQ